MTQTTSQVEPDDDEIANGVRDMRLHDTKESRRDVARTLSNFVRLRNLQAPKPALARQQEVAAPGGMPSNVREFVGEVADDTMLNNELRAWAHRLIAEDDAARVPVASPALTSEQAYAIKEAARIDTSDAYFGVRPQIDTLDRRKVFEAGFDRGYEENHPTPVGAGGEVGARPTPAEITALKERGDMEAFLKGLTKKRGYIALREFIRQLRENGSASDDDGEDTDALEVLADAIATSGQIHSGAGGAGVMDARPDSFHSDSGECDRVQGLGLTVLYRKMPESNGRNNWTAVLRGHGADYTIDRSEYPHRVRYAADCVRHIIGELPEKPFILDYDADERTPCHLCGGTGEKDGKPCWGLKFDGTTHNAATLAKGDQGEGKS